MKIVLPFPSSILAGHAKGNGQWAKVKATKEHREWAHLATLEARGPNGMLEDGQATTDTDKTDIAITIRFIPPHNRGDRMNYPARMKPYVDGIADALGVNDKRFHPLFVFCEPEKPGCVEVFIGGKVAINPRTPQDAICGRGNGPVELKTADASATNPRTRHNQNALQERSA